MVKSMGGLVVGILCLIMAFVSAFVFKRYVAASASAIIAIACIFRSVRM